MGSVKIVDLKLIREKCGLETFVETGLWKGFGIKHALRCGFNRVHSIEIKLEFCEKVRAEVSDDRLIIHHGESTKVLPGFLDNYELGKTFWWLDAHVPQLYQPGKKFTHETTFPLVEELDIISSKKDISQDVFLLDDMRFYPDLDHMIPMKRSDHAGHPLLPIIHRILPQKGVYLSPEGDGYLLIIDHNTLDLSGWIQIT